MLRLCCSDYALAITQSVCQEGSRGLCCGRYFTERLVRACAELPKMCQFFHIPFQSGSDEILREMKCALFLAHARADTLAHLAITTAGLQYVHG